MDGAEFEGGATHPIGKGGAVEIDALAAVDLGLPVKRQVIGIFADQHMGDCGLGRHAARDQPRRCGRLCNAIGAGPAGIFGTAGDDDTELGGHDVEPFRDILADAMQAAAAGAGQAVRLDDLFDARQVLWQRSTIGGTRFGGALGGPILGILFGMDHGHGRFEVFQRQFELVRIALLRFPTEDRLLEGRDQLFQPCDPLVLALVARIRGDQHRLQRSNFFKQISGLRHGRVYHTGHRRCPLESTNRVILPQGRTGHSTASGAFAAMARTRRQSSPANSASNCAWFISISPSFTAGQVKLCSSSRL
jgi:hypothetical protein